MTYLNNTAPHADAGNDFITCEPIFTLTAAKSYDVDWNILSYSWSLIDGSLGMEGASSQDLIVTSPVDLNQNRDYSFELIVTETIAGQQHCSDRDTVTVTVQQNICPVADAGKDRRIPKFEDRSVTLNAGTSYDPEGDELSFSWTAPNGSVTNDPVIIVSDLDPTSSYTKYTYSLQVTDSEGAVSVDEVDVVFVGPGDLSGEMGYPGDIYHPEVRSAIERVLNVTIQKGKIPGALVDVTNVEYYHQKGVRYLYHHINNFLTRGADEFLELVRDEPSKAH